MKYMGSKNRIAKYILPIILNNRKDNQYYVEPFVGGANLIDKVDGLRIGSDLNNPVIQALRLIRDDINKIPKNNSEFTEEDYKKVKSDGISNDLYGYAGYALSYAGKFYGGWCRDSAGKRDYVAEAHRNAVNQSPKIQGVDLYCASYDELKIPDNSIIYCDIPYKNTTKYKNEDFNYCFFYNWCKHMKSIDHEIFVSEYQMPSEFKLIWQKEIKSSLTKNTGSKKGIERLFKL